MQFLTKSPHAIDDLLRLFFNPPNFSAHFTRNISAHEVKTPVKDFNKSIDINGACKNTKMGLGTFSNLLSPPPFMKRQCYKIVVKVDT